MTPNPHDPAGESLRPNYSPSSHWYWEYNGGRVYVGSVRATVAEQEEAHATVQDLLSEVETTMGRRFRNGLDDAINGYQTSVRREAMARLFLALDGLLSG